MAQRRTLSDTQVTVLRWVADGCPDGVMPDSARISAGALRNRGLLTTAGRGASWTARITRAGRDYLTAVDGPEPPLARQANASVVRGLADGQAAAAAWNATSIIRLEQQLSLFVEPSVQAWAARTGWVDDVAAWAYINSHFVVTVGGLAFIYLFRNEAFYFVRNMFMIAMGIALVGYAAFPTAPPRLMPEWGFSDTVAAFTGVRPENEAVSALLNMYAAVPSMHVCFALMIGWPLARLVRPLALKLAWGAYPIMVGFVVIATGNHWILDAVLGVATAAVAALLAQTLLARWRPRAWSFRQTTATSPP